MVSGNGIQVVIPFLSVEDSQFVVNWEKGGDTPTLGFDIKDFVHHDDGKILKVMYPFKIRSNGELSTWDRATTFRGMVEEYNRGADEEQKIKDDDRIIEVSW